MWRKKTEKPNQLLTKRCVLSIAHALEHYSPECQQGLEITQTWDVTTMTTVCLCTEQNYQQLTIYLEKQHVQYYEQTGVFLQEDYQSSKSTSIKVKYRRNKIKVSVRFEQWVLFKL